MPELSLLDYYDLASDGTETNAFLTFLDTEIGIRTEENCVFIWFVENINIRKEFNIKQYTAQQFVDSVDDFVTENKNS